MDHHLDRTPQGERVRFEPGFEPATLQLTVGPHVRKLEPSRHPAWRADWAGALDLFADARTKGDASYVACIVFR